jgi:nucleotide-binding universal stress UspA family protein
MLMGDPPTCVTHEARRSASDLVVLGLHPYGTVDRLLGAETTVRVIANVGLPVLAVVSKLVHLPTSAIAAVDFSRASITAAKATARLMGPSGLLMLVYVQSGRARNAGEEPSEMVAVREQGIASSLTTLVQEIVAETPLSVKTVVLQGDPAATLREYADQVQPDLLAMGSQRHSVLRRLVVGSVTRRVVRDGRRTVFVVPPELPVATDGELEAA